ncbi:gamma-crystallin N isoform X1 [Coturnix japonica]|uniref:gamma-crystallin N isoform X1 n=1 Tax=Coturnix japonica TaxID=93934 RepID=UPI000776CC69|nr:gamma-crystallin N isoform X1 [Coturnix japonica]
MQFWVQNTMALMGMGLLRLFSKEAGDAHREWECASQGWAGGSSSAALQHRDGHASLCYGMHHECSDRSFSCVLISPGDISECSGGYNSLWVLFLVLLLTRPRCPQHGQHYRIELFEGSCFGGRSMELTEDCSCLQGRGWEQPHVNAIRVYGDGAWVLYEEPNYRGRMYVVERGEFGNFQAWQGLNASVQSVRRVINYF